VTALSSYRLPPWQAPPLPNVGHRGPTRSGFGLDAKSTP
jgi:hypothetical protein